MELQVSAEAKDEALNRRVAMAVVILSVAMGPGSIEDGDIVQTMQRAKANSVDRWGEYRATKTKWHIADTARAEISAIAGDHPTAAAGRASAGTGSAARRRRINACPA